MLLTVRTAFMPLADKFKNSDEFELNRSVIYDYVEIMLSKDVKLEVIKQLKKSKISKVALNPTENHVAWKYPISALNVEDASTESKKATLFFFRSITDGYGYETNQNDDVKYYVQRLYEIVQNIGKNLLNNRQKYTREYGGNKFGNWSQSQSIMEIALTKNGSLKTFALKSFRP